MIMNDSEKFLDECEEVIELLTTSIVRDDYAKFKKIYFKNEKYINARTIFDCLDTAKSSYNSLTNRYTTFILKFLRFNFLETVGDVINITDCFEYLNNEQSKILLNYLKEKEPETFIIVKNCYNLNNKEKVFFKEE
jgi:hypothetical protein